MLHFLAGDECVMHDSKLSTGVIEAAIAWIVMAEQLPEKVDSMIMYYYQRVLLLAVTRVNNKAAVHYYCCM